VSGLLDTGSADGLRELYAGTVRRFVSPYSNAARPLLRARLARLAALRPTVERFAGTDDPRSIAAKGTQRAHKPR
jgi:hypothetical protein